MQRETNLPPVMRGLYVLFGVVVIGVAWLTVSTTWAKALLSVIGIATALEGLSGY